MLTARPSQGDHVCPLGKADHLAQGHTANWRGQHPRPQQSRRQAGGGPGSLPALRVELSMSNLDISQAS